jgi:hypothetical protein
MLVSLIKCFSHILQQLSLIKNGNYSGTGLVLYNDSKLLSKYHCNLINNDQYIPFLTLSDEEIIHYLSHISNYQHPYHDGFHFINSKGILTHVAQFLSPPIDRSMISITGLGSRTFCSQCTSKIPGVIMIGSVSSTGKIHTFMNGELFIPCRDSYLGNVHEITLTS